MSSSPNFSVRLIGSGLVAQTIAGAAIEAGHQVKFSNSRGPDSLKDLVSQFGDKASAGTTAEAAQADIVILAVRWAQVPDAAKGVPDWDGRIVIDATNQSLTGADEVDLGDQTGSERNAALMPGALVVKAFNTVSATIVAKNLHRSDGPLVIFIAGDNVDAKVTVSAFIESLGLAPVDLGGAGDGRVMQWHRPLNSLHLVKIA
jgi:8-hydroxy-5-deazaflavin:NADPH oxidoreductase